jgi:uncharacterized repeat protein (TIGR01451 family)
MFTLSGESLDDKKQGVHSPNTMSRFLDSRKQALAWICISAIFGSAPVIATTADLVLTVTGSPNPAVAGSPLTLTCLVSNKGPDLATGLVLTNPLPPSVLFNSAVITNGGYAMSNNTFAWFVDGLASHDKMAVQMVLTPVSVQTLTNRCGVVANEDDPVPSNNLNRLNVITVKSVLAGASLNVPRLRHSATLLADGRVLLAGGWNTGSAQPSGSTDLYDPHVELFALSGNLQVPRFDHTATLLPDGFVLMVGGNTGGVSTASIELYNPTNGGFSLTNSLNVPRSGHTATRLADGRVVLAGGAADASVEIFSYTDGTVSSGGNMVAPRAGHVAALLPSGRILFAGGAADPASAEEYDPNTQSSVAVGSLVTNHTSLDGISLLSGKVLITGGTSAELYDPETKTFSLAAPVLSQRNEGRLVLLNDGRVLVSGGINALGYLSSTELYDPVTNAFTAGTPMTTLRLEHSATRLLDGRILLAGGRNGSVLVSSEIYVVVVDSDHDGMADDWELKYGLNPNDRNDALQDADGDGCTNLQEFLAGTDPLDPNSVMKISAAQVNSTTFHVQFTTVAGKRYVLERTTNLITWQTVTNNVQGTGANASVVDTLNPGGAAYRVELMR